MNNLETEMTSITLKAYQIGVMTGSGMVSYVNAKIASILSGGRVKKTSRKEYAIRQGRELCSVHNGYFAYICDVTGSVDVANRTMTVKLQ